jgi:hypothetical protein
MRVLCLVLLTCVCALADRDSDRQAIRKAIAVFNHESERNTVLAPGADVPDLARCFRPESSQVYFEVRSIRFVTDDVALADTTMAQVGTMVLNRRGRAFFVLKREGADWKIDSLRMAEHCLAVVPLRSGR